MKKVFLFLSIGFVLLAIPATVFLVGKNQEVRKRAAPATTLSFNPNTLTTKVGDTFSLDVKIETATNQVATVQLNIVYDPAYIEALDLTNGTLAPTIRVSKKIDPNGKASITVGAQSTAQPIAGTGTVATITLKALKASSSAVSVRFTGPGDTIANAIGEGQNDVIVGRSPAAVTILNVDGSSASSENIPQSTSTLAIASSSSLLTTSAPTRTATPSTTLRLASTPVASRSAEASASAVTVASIESNEEIATDKPTFSGKAPPGSTVTLTIYSEPRTVVVTVDENGNWTYTPEDGLESGPHTVVAMASDPTTGETYTSTVPFVVDTATDSAIPVSGNAETTILLLIIGSLLLGTGMLLPIVVR